MLDRAAALECTRVLRVLTDPTRLRMLSAAADRPSTLIDLAAAVGVHRSTASDHMAMLRLLGLAVSRKQGSRVIYSADRRAVIRALARVAAAFGRQDLRQPTNPQV